MEGAETALNVPKLLIQQFRYHFMSMGDKPAVQSPLVPAKTAHILERSLAATSI